MMSASEPGASNVRPAITRSTATARRDRHRAASRPGGLRVGGARTHQAAAESRGRLMHSLFGSHDCDIDRRAEREVDWCVQHMAHRLIASHVSGECTDNPNMTTPAT